jgi:hypothetical protein
MFAGRAVRAIPLADVAVPEDLLMRCLVSAMWADENRGFVFHFCLTFKMSHGRSGPLALASGWALFSFGFQLSTQHLGTDVLPHTNLHDHHVLERNPTCKRRVWRERIALSCFRNNALLVQRKHDERQ